MIRLEVEHLDTVVDALVESTDSITNVLKFLEIANSEKHLHPEDLLYIKGQLEKCVKCKKWMLRSDEGSSFSRIVKICVCNDCDKRKKK